MRLEHTGGPEWHRPRVEHTGYDNSTLDPSGPEVAGQSKVYSVYDTTDMGAALHNSSEDVSEEQPPFIVDDYVIRIEWQKRGMPHAHILLWSSSATQGLKRDEAEPRNVIAKHDFGHVPIHPSVPCA